MKPKYFLIMKLTVGYRLHKPVSEWLEKLPLDITALNMREYFLLDINKMERNGWKK